MKKLITILVIMIVLVGAVFAAPSAKAQEANGTALIDVIATILEESPRFELAVKSGATPVSGGANDGIDAVSSDTTIDYSELSAADAAALAVDTDATVVFSINQIASARSNATYDLTVTAGDLELIEYSDGSDAPASASLKANEKFTVKTASTTLEVGSAGASIKGAVLTSVEMASVAVSGSVLTVDYHGVVAASTDAKKELGKYTVVWNHNADAVSGKYQAAVTLTVAAK